MEVSTAHAVPDANILTMSDYLDAASDMNDAVNIPVIVDADTGYGNSNNVIYMVKKFEAAGIAAVCIEDKLFPKVNSFIPGRQDLAPIAEFVGKIMAAKNAQQTEDFCVFARVEALIAGWGMDEALKRAGAYARAGADGIFIHSKATTAQEIHDFIASWQQQTPLIVCPTTYPEFTLAAAQETRKVKIYIFANHGIRAAIRAMENTFARLAGSGDIRCVENDIAPMKQVFAIQGMPQMKEAEKKYLLTQEPIHVLIPAAGNGSGIEGFDEILRDRPVALLDVNGKSVLQRNLEIFQGVGLQNITIVTGYCKEKIDPQRISPAPEQITIIENEQYRQKGIVHSIMCARGQLSHKVVICYSDILFEKSIVERLLKCEHDICHCYRLLLSSKPARWQKTRSGSGRLCSTV